MSDNEEESVVHPIPGLASLAPFTPKPNQAADWLNSTCGKCKYFVQVPDRERIAMVGLNGPMIGHCREAPPAVVVTGMSRHPNGQTAPNLTMTYPQFPDVFPACSRYNPR